MKNVDALLRRRAHALAAEDAAARQLFGGLWQGEPFGLGIDPRRLYPLGGRIPAACAVAHRLPGAGRSRARDPARPDLSRVGALRAAAAAAASRLGGIGRASSAGPEGYLAAEPLAAIAERAASLAGQPSISAPALGGFVALLPLAGLPTGFSRRAPAQSHGRRGSPSRTLGRAFRRAFLQQWPHRRGHGARALRDFHALTHEERIAEFETARRKGIAGEPGNARRPPAGRAPAPAADARGPGRPAFPQNARWRASAAHAPLRKTLRQAGAAIRAIKPCFMMSPLTVAQLLKAMPPPSTSLFSNEASQLPGRGRGGGHRPAPSARRRGDPKHVAADQLLRRHGRGR